MRRDAVRGETAVRQDLLRTARTVRSVLSPRPLRDPAGVLFLDAIYLPVRPSGPKEGVMCAWRSPKAANAHTNAADNPSEPPRATAPPIPKPASLQPLPPTGATGLEPATSGVTGASRDQRRRRKSPAIRADPATDDDHGLPSGLA